MPDFKEQKFCHVMPLIYELHSLPIRYRIEFKILLITFKILNFLAPSYLSSLISLRLPSKYNLRNSSDKLLLSYPRFKSKARLGDRSFTCAEGGVRVCGDAVLRYFWCGFAVIFILTRGIAVSKH